jgi:hypothetical protein
MIVKLPIVARIVMIFAIVVSVSMFAKVNASTSSSNTAGEEENGNFLKGINIPNDRYLQVRVSVNNFNLTVDLAIIDDQKAEG